LPIYERVLFRCIKCSNKEYRLVEQDKYIEIDFKVCPLCGSYMEEVSNKNVSMLDEVKKSKQNKSRY